MEGIVHKEIVLELHSLEEWIARKTVLVLSFFVLRILFARCFLKGLLLQKEQL